MQEGGVVLTKYTISDVAEMLGVSRATVSRAMNNSPGVSAELRNRIITFINEIGYRPNSLARGLSKGHSSIVGLILGDVRNPFYADLAFYIQKILNNNGYMVMVFNSEYDSKKEIEFIQHAVHSNFAGLFLITAQTDGIKDSLEKLDIPLVLVNRIIDSFEANSVLLDNFKAGYIATMHLIELGHPRIAFIEGQSTSSTARQRFDGYRQALKNYNIQFDENYVLNSDLKLETGYELAKQYISKLDGAPKAVVIVNDMTAIGFMEYCRMVNIRVPEDISIVSFDNISISSLYDIQLTTVSQHVFEMSEQAVRLMLKLLINPNAKAERIILDPTLVVRNTTAKYNK